MRCNIALPDGQGIVRTEDTPKQVVGTRWAACKLGCISKFELFWKVDTLDFSRATVVYFPFITKRMVHLFVKLRQSPHVSSLCRRVQDWLREESNITTGRYNSKKYYIKPIYFRKSYVFKGSARPPPPMMVSQNLPVGTPWLNWPRYEWDIPNFENFMKSAITHSILVQKLCSWTRLEGDM